MRVVFFASAFPGSGAGIDMVHARRARALARHAEVVAVVPTPWAPRAVAALSARWGAYARLGGVSHLDGIPVVRPRYLQVPRSGALAGLTMALGAYGVLRELRARGACDVIFAQGIVPDGLAAVLLGGWTGARVACLGRGSDVHGLPRSPLARSLAAFTVDRAAGVAVVARQLARTLEPVGHGRSITVLPNGIDLERFVPGDRAAARRTLDVDPDARVVLYVGRLARGKGLHELIEGFTEVVAADPEAGLALVGSGPLREELERAARELGIASRVHFAGEVPHDGVPTWMQAADVLALPSAAEGFPNVIREALACGRPVVATPVGDVPRLVTPDVGYLVPVADPGALATALGAALRGSWDVAAIRRRVAGMTWERNAEATHHFLEAALCA
jgi:teichuronic acid biosynthesis glycosyltransferase TuaC